LSDDVERRLIDLEARLAHHERMAEEMSDQLVRQSRVIDLLNQRVDHLWAQLQEIAAGWTNLPGEEPPPPHY